MVTIYFMRHGDVHNPDSVYYGRLPGFRLSDLGERQAQQAAEWLAQHAITAVYHSPLLRAQQTAAIVAAHNKVPLNSSELLLEVHTPYDGTPRSELDQRDWDLYNGTSAPFEQPDDIIVRIRRFVKQAAADHQDEAIVAVSHGDVVAFTVLWASGRAPSQQDKARLAELNIIQEYPDTASLSCIRFDAEGNPQPPINYYNVWHDNATGNDEQ